MTTSKFYKVTMVSGFSGKVRETVVKARTEREAIANAKNIRPMHDYSHATAQEVEAQPTAKGVGANHNNH